MAFTDPVALMPVPGTGKYCLIRPLHYQIGFYGSDLTVTVPDGFLTDLASVPRLFWIVVPPFSPDYAAAAVLHDYLCEWNGEMFSKIVADAVFYEALKVLGVPTWRAILMYAAVRAWHITRSWKVDPVGVGSPGSTTP